MKVERKSFPVRFRPDLVDRIDAAKGPLSRNRWLEALVERELGALEAPTRTDTPATATQEPPDLMAALEASLDIAETGEPSGLEPMDAEPVADPIIQDDGGLGPCGEEQGALADAGEDWWK